MSSEEGTDRSLTSQKQRRRRRLDHVQATQREPELVINLHIKLKAIRLIPSPPSDLGLQTSSQATLACLFEFGVPEQRKPLHILSSSLRHLLGSLMTKNQKLFMLIITVFISWSRPAYDKALLDQDRSLVLILSMRGS